jgi:AdoMet-dependent heme synthase
MNISENGLNLLEGLHKKVMRGNIPLTVQFDLTYRCHHQCVHCYLPESWRRGVAGPRDLELNQVKDILDQLAQAGTFLLTFSGGEIFLRRDLLDIVQHARRLDFCISLMTTGTRGPNEEQIRLLSDLGVNGVLFSVYSLDPQVHDAITRVPGSWARVWHTIQRCREQGVLAVFNTPFLNMNYDGLPQLKKFAEHEGIPIRVNPKLAPRWDGRPHEPILALTSASRKILGELDLLQLDCPVPGGEPVRMDHACGAGANQCYITPRGEVWPCMEIPWECGRLTKDRFEDIWENSETLEMVRQLQEREVILEERLCDHLKMQAGGYNHERGSGKKTATN